LVKLEDSILVKPKIAVFSGANSTIANSPALVTSNKARLPGERKLPGRFDHLVPQVLFEPVNVKIKKFSAHPLESDSSEVYNDDGKDYYEATLTPEDGFYLLPYMARRKDSSTNGRPFESNDLSDPTLDYGGRQFFYPDASRIFDEIDRTISGRDPSGLGNTLCLRADYEFVRVLPAGGYTKKGEIAGVDYFPYRPEPKSKVTRRKDLGRVANSVQKAFASGQYHGGIWLDGSPQLEETLYWLSLTIDTDLPIVGVSSQRTHGQLSNDGDRNIVDAVDYIVSGKGNGLGAVAVLDQRIFASRDLKKGDSRPGGYKVSGGQGGVLGSISSTGFKSDVTIWYRPNYKHTSSSEVNLHQLPAELAFRDSIDGPEVSLQVKKVNEEYDFLLVEDVIPSVDIIKYGSYSQETEQDDNISEEVAINALIEKATQDQKTSGRTKLHGIVLEGSGGLAKGTRTQTRALSRAAMRGIPVARVFRSDPEGKITTNPNDLTIEGSNLDSNKARLLLIASLLKLGRLPKAKDANNPTSKEADAVREKIGQFQEIFETH
jgi:L-asparaginase